MLSRSLGVSLDKTKFHLHFTEFLALHNRCSRRKFCTCNLFTEGSGLLLLKSLNGDQRENEEEQEATERDLGPRPSLGASCT